MLYSRATGMLRVTGLCSLSLTCSEENTSKRKHENTVKNKRDKIGLCNNALS